MVRQILSYLKECKSLLLELHKREHISMPFLWVDSIWAFLKHGIYIKQYTLGNIYKIPRVLWGRVFSQRRLETVIRLYNSSDYIHYLENKTEFNLYFNEWVKRRWLYSKTMSEEDFNLLIDGCKSIFVKPLDAQEGEGIRRIELVKGSCPLFEELKNENVIIEEAVVPHQKMRFGNTALNTVRVITCLDGHGSPHILRAALRVAVGDSIVDNYTTGGALYDIDIDSGVIDAKGIGHNYEHLIFHPGTDICMMGFQIPNWQELIDGVKSAALHLPQCRFIGWDVAITAAGIELIEGNHNPGLFAMESIGKPCSYADAISCFNR